MGKASRRRMAGRETARPTRTPRRIRAAALSVPFVARPFEGLVGETDWVAMREIVPAATAEITLRAGFAADRADPLTATVATVLPMAWPGLHRADGDVIVGIQSGSSSGDTSRDLAASLLAAVEAERGAPVTGNPLVTPETPRLQDLLDPAAPFTVTVHEGFDFWLPPGEDLDAEGMASLERANETVIPTVRLTSVESAYWCRIGERSHLRWVLPHDEDAATNALARLHAAGESGLDISSRLLGAFRACGLLVPVWDLDPLRAAEDYEDVVADFATRLAEALARGADLSGDERRARAGLLNRQITLR